MLAPALRSRMSSAESGGRSPSAMSEPLLIRSYRQVFSLQRRLYGSIAGHSDPGRRTARRLLYFGGALAGVCVLGALPLVAVRRLSWSRHRSATSCSPEPRGARHPDSARWTAGGPLRARLVRLPRQGVAARRSPTEQLAGEIALRSDHHRPLLVRARVRGSARLRSSAPAALGPSLLGGVALRPSEPSAASVDVSLAEGELLEIRP